MKAFKTVAFIALAAMCIWLSFENYMLHKQLSALLTIRLKMHSLQVELDESKEKISKLIYSLQMKERAEELMNKVREQAKKADEKLRKSE